MTINSESQGRQPGQYAPIDPMGDNTDDERFSVNALEAEVKNAEEMFANFAATAKVDLMAALVAKNTAVSNARYNQLKADQERFLKTLDSLAESNVEITADLHEKIVHLQSMSDIWKKEYSEAATLLKHDIETKVSATLLNLSTSVSTQLLESSQVLVAETEKVAGDVVDQARKIKKELESSPARMKRTQILLAVNTLLLSLIIIKEIVAGFF